MNIYFLIKMRTASGTVCFGCYTEVVYHLHKFWLALTQKLFTIDTKILITPDRK